MTEPGARGRDITASILNLLKICGAVQTLEWSETVSDPMTRGTMFHQFVGDCITKGREVALGLADKSISNMTSFDIRDVIGSDTSDYLSEVSFSWNPEDDIAIELGLDLQRDYKNSPAGWIAGTADIIKDGDETVFVDELKTGRSAVPDVQDNWQVKFLCLAAARALHKKSAVGRIIKVGVDGELAYTDSHRFDSWELDKIKTDLWEIIWSEKFVVGDHCKWCPAFIHCPQQSKTALALVNDQTQLTVNTFPDVWKKVQAIKHALKKVTPALERFIEIEGTQDLGDGTEVMMHSTTRESVDVYHALSILEEHAGWEVRDAACSISKSSIKRAINEHVDDPLIQKNIYSTVMDSLESRDGLLKTQSKPTAKVKKKQ